MEPPSKRPRLSLFASYESDSELDTARQQNDSMLKSRFESIFAKYERDFTGVGDEIDLATGEIVVDNGHLASMTADEDGVVLGEIYTGTSAAHSKSMLRAMTVVPESEGEDNNFEADNVLASIESFTASAIVARDVDSDAESEDDLFGTGQESSTRQSPHEEYGVALGDSDHDSLFDVADYERSTSPDSLFDGETPASASKQNNQFRDTKPSKTRSPVTDDDDEKATILAKFGLSVGEEILALLEKKHDAHIEPAWRVPVSLPTRQTPCVKSASQTPLSADPSPAMELPKSLWKLPQPRRSKHERHAERVRELIRAESEDPLQEDFGSVDEQNESSTLASLNKPAVKEET